MLRKMAIALCATAALGFAFGLFLPRDWSVERSVVIARSPAEIHPLVATPQRWHEWVVWTKGRDAHSRYSYAGPIEGADSERSWIGPVAGQGRIRIGESDPAAGVRITATLESNEPNAHILIRYEAVELGGEPGGQRRGQGTRVTWRDEGRLPLPFGGYFRGTLEETLSSMLEESLGRLKELAEQQPPTRPASRSEPATGRLGPPTGASVHVAGAPALR